MKKKTIKKEMTLNELATVMARGFERSDKQIEDLAAMVAKGFERVDKRFEEVETNLDIFKKDTEQNFKKVDENFVKVRNDILTQGGKFVSKNEFDKFVSRFNVLEAKVKGKK